MVKRLGLIVRSDFGGGLANQSLELWKHLEPEATLVVLMGDRGRGTVEHFAAYDPAYLVHYLDGSPQAIATMEEFLDGIDVMLSIETFYQPYLVTRAPECHVERVLYANPELLNKDDPAEKADRYLWPDSWVHDYPAPGEILPWPCSTEVTPRAEINWPPRFVHVGAPAMLDRNGTEVVDAAQLLTNERMDVCFYGRTPFGFQGCNSDRGNVYEFPHVEDHWDLYRDADVLVLPRRYGCLSMTMLEAAAMGVPTLTTDLAPQNGWFKKWGPWLLIPPGDQVMASMKGSHWGRGEPGVGVFQPDPARLALAMDRLAARADVLDALRVEVREWAEARSWDVLRPAWEKAIRG